MEKLAGISDLLEQVSEGLAEKGIYLPPEAVEYLTAFSNGEVNSIECWRSELVQRNSGSKIEGRGLFSRKRLPRGEILPGEVLAIKPGSILSGEEVVSNSAMIQGTHQQIGIDVFLAGRTPEEVDENLVGYNHSCEPNAKVIILDGIPMGFLVGRKPIGQDEEITVDYATCYISETARIMECKCGSENCRATINPGWDWMDPVIQEKYAGEFPDYIQRKIDAYNLLSPEEKARFHEEAVAFAFANEIVRLDFIRQHIQGKMAELQQLPDLSNRGYITLNRRVFLQYENDKRDAWAKLNKANFVQGFYQFGLCRDAIPYFNRIIVEEGLGLPLIDEEDPLWRDKALIVAYEIDKLNTAKNTLVQKV